MTDLPELMTVKELQNYLHIGKDKAYELVKDKSFPSLRIGGRYYVLKSEFAEWLHKQGRSKWQERPCRGVCAAVCEASRSRRERIPCFSRAPVWGISGEICRA